MKSTSVTLETCNELLILPFLKGEASRKKKLKNLDLFTLRRCISTKIHCKIVCLQLYIFYFRQNIVNNERKNAKRNSSNWWVLLWYWRKYIATEFIYCKWNRKCIAIKMRHHRWRRQGHVVCVTLCVVSQEIFHS